MNILVKFFHQVKVRDMGSKVSEFRICSDCGMTSHDDDLGSENQVFAAICPGCGSDELPYAKIVEGCLLVDDGEHLG